jgi:hypothetical protein
MNAVVPATDTVRAHAERLLAALGDTPAQIAATLLAAGHHGRPQSEDCCPVARYLLASLDIKHLNVIGNIVVLAYAQDPPRICDYVDVPDPVEEFIERFDNGDFPQLHELAVAR